jgi:hypothetical protein
MRRRKTKKNDNMREFIICRTQAKEEKTPF